MAQQLKRWESPRRKGRNHKGRGGSAKQRQYIKRQKLLRKRLQTGIDSSAAEKARTHGNIKKGEARAPLFFYGLLLETFFKIVAGVSPAGMFKLLPAPEG